MSKSEETRKANMKPEILMLGPMMSQFMVALERHFIVHQFWDAPDRNALLEKVGPNVKALATNGAQGASGSLINALPNLVRNLEAHFAGKPLLTPFSY